MPSKDPRPIILGTERQWKGACREQRYKTVDEKMIDIFPFETLGILLGNDTTMAEMNLVIRSYTS